LFRPLDVRNKDVVINKPISSTAMNTRLKDHLQGADLWQGETVHGARSGCAITLQLLGIAPDIVSSHVGWRSPSMCQYYTGLQQLDDQCKVADALAASTSSGGSTDTLRAVQVAQLYYDSMQSAPLYPVFSSNTCHQLS
jgi:hypothetical protein